MKKYAFNILLFFLFLIISCTSPTEPEQNTEDDFLGQLEADIDHVVLKPDGYVWAWGGGIPQDN